MKTKSRKWYRRVLYHFLDLALVNAYILYKQTTNMPLYQFKLDVALALMYGEAVEDPMDIQVIMEENAVAVTMAANGDPVGSATVLPCIRFDKSEHYPGVAAKKGRTCKVEGCKARTVVWCKKCKVYLCVKLEKDGETSNCFEKFHK